MYAGNLGPANLDFLGLLKANELQEKTLEQGRKLENADMYHNEYVFPAIPQSPNLLPRQFRIPPELGYPFHPF